MYYVLILVLLEYTLGDETDKFFQREWKKVVLILVLLEYTLGEYVLGAV